jgi:hypothetical protein
VVERAFAAGACIAGTLSHNDCANLMQPRCTKSSITRIYQRVSQMAKQLFCSVSDPRCFKSPVDASSNTSPFVGAGQHTSTLLVATRSPPTRYFSRCTASLAANILAYPAPGLP